MVLANFKGSKCCDPFVYPDILTYTALKYVIVIHLCGILARVMQSERRRTDPPTHCSFML